MKKLIRHLRWAWFRLMHDGPADRGEGFNVAEYQIARSIQRARRQGGAFSPEIRRLAKQRFAAIRESYRP